MYAWLIDEKGVKRLGVMNARPLPLARLLRLVQLLRQHLPEELTQKDVSTAAPAHMVPVLRKIDGVLRSPLSVAVR